MQITIQPDRNIDGVIMLRPARAWRTGPCSVRRWQRAPRTSGIWSSARISPPPSRRRASSAPASPPAGTMRSVEGLGRFLPVEAPVDCCESGSTLRFLIPIASLTGQAVSFTGRGRLMERPQSVYEALYREQGLRFEQSAAGLTVEGALTPANTALQAMYPASSSAGCCLLCRCFPATARCTSSRRWRAAATSI